MKPQTITASTLKYPFQIADVVEWLKANGCRHHVPEDARIVVTGNWIIVPTLDIGRTYNPKYWGDYKRTDSLPVKIRKYRIRHELTPTAVPDGAVGAGEGGVRRGDVGAVLGPESGAERCEA